MCNRGADAQHTYRTAAAFFWSTPYPIAYLDASPHVTQHRRPPRVPGLSRPDAAAALLSGQLRADSAPPAPTGRRSLASGLTAAEAAEARRRANKDASNMGFGGGGGDGEDEDEEGPYGGDLAGGGASAYGGRGAFVPYYMRHEVERYVSYGSYLQEMLSRPLHVPPRDGGGGGEGGSGRAGGGASSRGGGDGSVWGGDDARSQVRWGSCLDRCPLAIPRIAPISRSL